MGDDMGEYAIETEDDDNTECRMTKIQINNDAAPVAANGFDIAGMCGIFLGGAYYGVPVLMDGFISNVAALCAVRICPNAEKAVLASHTSTEPAVQAVMEAIGRKPLISAGMRLGEGTGAAAGMPLLDMALAVFRSAYPSEEGGIEPYKPC